MTKRLNGLGAILAVAALITAACGGGGSSKAATSNGPTTVRLGYFPNVTHAVALVGIDKGIFAKDLGTDKLDASKTFNAGPAATEAILSGAIDATFIGPSPSITAFTQSHGAVRIVSGAASGGAGPRPQTADPHRRPLPGQTTATPPPP